MKMRSKLPSIEGRRLTTELTIHNNDFGGVTAVIYGSKGSGKTTLFLTLCQTVQCYNKDNQLELETSIWRGGDEDYWTWLPYERTRVFIHRDNFETVSFKRDEDLMEFDRKDLPEIIMYKNNKDLYDKLLRGGINVIYEPTTYTLEKRLQKMIQKRGVMGDDMFKNKSVDSIIWWFEFIDWLRVNKSLEHISVFIDEADQLLPVSPSGVRWHLNLWFKDIMRALRKRNISLFMACHGFTDIDGRMRPKIMYRIYMKGSCTPSESLIFKTAPVTLPQGKYYIERDAWGWARFNKIDEQPRVLVVLKQNDDSDDYMKEGKDNPPENPGSGSPTTMNIKINKRKQETDNDDADEDKQKKTPIKKIAFAPDIIYPKGIEKLPADRKPGEFKPIQDTTTIQPLPDTITKIIKEEPDIVQVDKLQEPDEIPKFDPDKDDLFE